MFFSLYSPSLGELMHSHATNSDSDAHESARISPALIPLPSTRLPNLRFDLSVRLLKLASTKLELFLHFLRPCFPPSSPSFSVGCQRPLSSQGKIPEVFLDYSHACTFHLQSITDLCGSALKI